MIPTRGVGAPALDAAADSVPLSLYIHIPWCLRKCRYCDFASRARSSALPESAYCDALLRDLTEEIAGLARARRLTSIFIGGGTPSLFSGPAIDRLLTGVRGLVELAPDAEVTLEANPGAADTGRLATYRAAGVNRLSIGAQSLSATPLRRLGRAHAPDDVRAAVSAARAAGIANINLDLMYGLPRQTAAEVEADIEAAIALSPEHISYYQLTLEPGTPLYRDRPALPDEDFVADHHAVAVHRLAEAGFSQYETSAFAQPDRRCRHNVNYWEFGDYLGIGTSAHGKVSFALPHDVRRRIKHEDPARYLAASGDGAFTRAEVQLRAEDLVLEFMINALRLAAGFPIHLFQARTGLPPSRIAPHLAEARDRGLIEVIDGRVIVPTALGRTFLDDLLSLFVPG
jgi:oxygen-independent coproporphyrinogen-3 oxidase